jgi:hypothetical protein
VRPPVRDDHADLWTNIAGALRLAGETLLDQAPDATVYRTLLITDGKANVDPYTSGELARIVSEFAAQGVGVDALGIGEDAENEVLAEVVGATGQTQHVWAMADDVARVDTLVGNLLYPFFTAVGGRGELRIRVNPDWTVEAALRVVPQTSRLQIPSRSAKGTDFRLPLLAVGRDDDRPVYLLRLRAPSRETPRRELVQVRGGLVVDGRRVDVDQRSGPSDYRARVTATVASDANPYLDWVERRAELAEEVEQALRGIKDGAGVERIYQDAEGRALKLGFDELADLYRASLKALSLDVSPKDVKSTTAVGGTRLRTRTRDLLDPQERYGPHGWG